MLALAAGTGSAAHAQTQDVPRVISPLRVESDHNNVNLVSGKTTIEAPVLSVPGAPNLRFDRVQNAAPYVVGRVSGQAGEPPVGDWTVHTGTGATEGFRCVDWVDCDSVTGTGSTFRGPAGSNGANGTFKQAGTGATWHFTRPHALGPGPVRQSYASNVSYPTGENITYTYQTTSGGAFGNTFYRPVTITSNHGFFISISYQSDDFNSSFWGTVAQAAIYSSADPATPLRRLTYSGSTITDSGGTIADTSDDRILACSGCVGQLGVDIEVTAGMAQLHGEASPALQVAAHPSGPVVQSVTRDGVQWTYSYGNLRSSPGNFGYLYDSLTATGPNGFNQVYTFQAVGPALGKRNVLTSVRDSINRTTAYQFDTAFRPTRITSPEGNQVSVLYDDMGNIISRTATPKAGSGLSPVTEQAGYPAAPNGMPNTCNVLCWRPSWTRDGMGRQTDYVYNGNGQLTEQTDPADANGVRRRTIVEYALSPAGISRRSAVRTCAVGSTCGTNAEFRTEYEYWGNTLLPSLERRRDLSTGAALETRYTYDASGRLLSADGPLPGSDDATYSRHDVHGRKTWEIGARGPNGLRIATRTTYRDSDDKPISTETGTIPDADSIAPTIFRRTDFAYDSRRNPVREAVSAGGTTHSVTDRSFDQRGQLLCAAVRMNPAAAGPPPADACAVGAPGSHGPDRITRNFYDAGGQRLQLREGVGTPDEAAEATWAYSPNGQIVTIIDGNGNRAELRYDGHGRQDRWTFPAAARPSAYNDATQATALATAGSVNANDFEAYSYDAAGNRTNLRRRDGRNIAFAYDALNRVTAKTYPQGGARPVFYGYDIRGLQLFARYDSPSGEGIANAYDGFGRLVSSSTNMGGTTRTLTYQWDAASNRSRITHPDGLWFDLLHDALNRPVYLSQTSSFGLAFTSYLPNGLPSGTSRGNNSLSPYDYDGVQRLNYLGHWFPNAAGNGLWTYARNPAGQIASVTSYTDTYSWPRHYAVNRLYATDGLNRYSAVGPLNFQQPYGYDANGNLTSDGARTYSYDIENRLVGSGNLTLAYDPLGRLFQTSGTGLATTRFLYDGDALVAEYDGAGLMTHRYVHWAGADVPMVSYAGSDLAQPSYLYADHQGSIIAVANANGQTVTPNAYDEYGFPAVGNVGRFQYTGQIWISELGMYHYKARVYSPALGRFLQTDPVGYDDQFNLYAYVGNDPVNLRDPTGTLRCSGFFGCVVEAAETTGRTARDSGRWVAGRVVAAAAALGLATDTIATNTRESVRIPVFRVFDGERATQHGNPRGSSWTQEDPRQMDNWRDRLAVYPGWNSGTRVVEGYITMQDMADGNVLPGPGPHSTAGPQPRNEALSGGPYRGEGNETIIRNSATTVKEQRVTPMCHTRTTRLPTC